MLPVLAALITQIVAFPPHRLSLDFGVPVPLSVYGYRSKDGAKGLVWLGAVRLDYRYRVAQSVDFGVWVNAANVHGEDGAATADIYFVTTGLMVAYEVPFAPCANTPHIDFALGLGVMWNGIMVDDGIDLHTTSLGANGRVRLSFPLSPWIALGLSATLDVFAPPLNRTTWFNTELLETVVLGFTLGGTASW
jgi:hypothetical protein